MAKSESTKIEFGYFHDYESEQFAFTVFPKCYSQMNISVICPAMQRFFMG